MTTVSPESQGFTQLRIPKMAELVAQQLRRQIISGELNEGDALPSEASLMARYGVSRPTLREAFRVLESEGLISVRRGAHGGARVHPPNGDAAARYAGQLLEYRNTTLEDVYQARNIIEPPCAALLARRRVDSDIEALRAQLETARANLDESSTIIRLHNEFHSLMIELAGNQTMVVLNGMLRRIIDLSSLVSMEPDVTSPKNIEAIQKGFHAHQRLIQLIERRHFAKAEELWRQHLIEYHDYMLTGHNPETVLDLMD